MKKMAVGLFVLILLCSSSAALAVDTLTCWFPPGWKSKTVQAEAITQKLSEKSGLVVQSRIAKSYPEILTAFAADEPSLVYVGSFVQSIIVARKLGTPLAQNVNGREMYSGVLIYPDGQDPLALLKNHPAEIAFAVGASSGESSAKAATKGQAALGVANHRAAVNAIKAGEAKAAVVKNWWWADNGHKFPGMKSFEIPGVSVQRNPDNVLTASKAVSKEIIEKMRDAAFASGEVFDVDSVMLPFESRKLSFSLGLMQRGGIDPLTYSW